MAVVLLPIKSTVSTLNSPVAVTLATLLSPLKLVVVAEIGS